MSDTHLHRPTCDLRPATGVINVSIFGIVSWVVVVLIYLSLTGGI